MDVREAFGIQPVADGDSQPEWQSLLGLHLEYLAFDLGVVGGQSGEEPVANVIQGDMLYERNHGVDAGIQRARNDSRDLTYQNAASPTRHYRNRGAYQQR